MPESNPERSIFRRGSTTYYWSSRFFPREEREDVFKLYSFVRTVDDMVDAVPPAKARFRAFRRAWDAAAADLHFDTVTTLADDVDERVIKNMVHVSRKYGFDPAWVEAFFVSMEADLRGRRYKTIDDTIAYMYGSAEVIGLMMAKIMGLSPAAYEAARMQGRAMQFINFIRDIAEDEALGRCYFPEDDIKRFGLPDLSRASAQEFPAAFKKFIHFELSRYKKWQIQAAEGFEHIPRRMRIPLKTAVDMYNWTGVVVGRRPHVIFDHKIKPTRQRVLRSGAKNLLVG